MMLDVFLMLGTLVPMLLSIIMVSVFFKEKFTLKAFLGILLAFAALMIMNI